MRPRCPEQRPQAPEGGSWPRWGEARRAGADRTVLRAPAFPAGRNCACPWNVGGPFVQGKGSEWLPCSKPPQALHLHSPGPAPSSFGSLGLSSKVSFPSSPLIHGEAPPTPSASETHWVMKGNQLSESLRPSPNSTPPTPCSPSLRTDQLEANEG